MAWPPVTHQDVTDQVNGKLAIVDALNGPVIARRNAARARAVTDATLAETLPNSSIGAASFDTGSYAFPTTWIQSIPSGVVNPTFRYTGAAIAQAGTVYPDTTFVTGIGLDSTFGALPYAVEFTYTGARFHFEYKWNRPSSFRIWADGINVGSAVAPSGTPDGSYYYHTVTLPDARTRRIRLEFSGGVYFYGIGTEASTTVSYPTGQTKGPRVIVLGDSYIEGTGATTASDTLTYRLSKAMGWNDLWASGSGGTGYLTVPGSPTGRKTFRQRAQTDVINPAPNIVIIAGGLNDRSLLASDVGTEAGLLFDMLKAGLPNTEFIVVGPWGPRDASLLSANTFAMTAAIKAAAEARTMFFIDPIAENWITGTGYVGATNGTGNSDTYIGSDSTHPTDAGHAYLSARLAGHLRVLI